MRCHPLMGIQNDLSAKEEEMGQRIFVACSLSQPNRSSFSLLAWMDGQHPFDFTTGIITASAEAEGEK